MSILKMLFKEIGRRKLNFLLALSAVSVAMGVFVWLVASSNVNEMAVKKAEVIARKMAVNLGYNLIVLPKSMPLDEYWVRPDALAEYDMPEEYVTEISKMEDIVADHFLAKLEQWVPWEAKSGQLVLLTGIRKELGVEGRKKKKSMLQPVKPGNVFVGYGLAKKHALALGSTLTFKGKEFNISRLLKEHGSNDDFRVYMQLHDMQAVVKKPGRINAIDALGCRCSSGKILDVIRSQLAVRLPETQVLEKDSIARHRENQRKEAELARLEAERKSRVLFPVIFLASMAWIGIIFLLNVRQRQKEIGILRALGVSGSKIAFLFIGKAVILGVLGAGIGFGLGAVVTMQVGSRLAEISMVQIYPVLPWCFGIAPLIAILAVALPTLHAVTLDPVLVLRED